MIETYCGDCLEVMKGIPDKSVDIVIMDPPYYKVMLSDFANVKYDWDDQWDTLEDYEKWIGKVFSIVKEKCKNTASIYCFADDLIAAHVQIVFERYFNILNNIVWYKPNNMAIKGWKMNRKYSPATERILFGEIRTALGMPLTGLQMIHSDLNCFGPIRDFFVAGKERWMKDHNANTEQFNQWINEVTETKSVASRHYFAVSQYVFPTFENYAKMRATGYWQYHKGGDIREEYEGLREEYEGLREEYEGLRRPFNQDRYLTDVWECPICAPNEDRIHPTQKPASIIRRMLRTSSRGERESTRSIHGVRRGRVRVRKIGYGLYRYREGQRHEIKGRQKDIPDHGKV